MDETDGQLNSLDVTFALKCMESTTRQVGHMEGGYDSATGGKSRDTSSVSVPRTVRDAHFPIPTTIEPFFKWVRDDEGPRNDPPQFALDTTSNTINKSEEGGWACPILEETPPS